jgi:replicative DNA helicase
MLANNIALGKTPPQNIEAEEAVLGSILMNSNSINRVVEIINPDAFYSPINKMIYDAMLTLFNQSKPIDALTVADILNQEGSLKKSAERNI